MPIVSEEHKNQRKREILSSALACFTEKGYDAATVDDIVKHSGISKGSIYNYFKSKEEIYLELLENTKDVYDDIFSEIKKLDTAIDKLHLLFDVFVNLDPNSKLEKAYSLVKFEFQLASSRNKEFREVLEKELKSTKMTIVEEILKEGIDSGQVREGLNIQIYSEMFWSFIDGATLQNLLFPNYPYQELLQEQKSIFLKKIMKIN